jgi:uncharacterized membrane protein
MLIVDIIVWALKAVIVLLIILALFVAKSLSTVILFLVVASLFVFLVDAIESAGKD